MEIQFSVIFSLLTQSPGNLIYHLVIILALALVLVASTQKRFQKHSLEEAPKVMIGSGILLLIHLLVFAGFSLAKTGYDAFNFPLANLERAACTLTIIWLTWTFLEYRKSSPFTILAIVVTSIVILLSVFLLLFSAYSQEQSSFFSQRALVLWQAASLAFALSCLVLMLFKRPPQWVVAVIILASFSSGLLMQLWLINPQTTAMGAVRLAQILTLPWIIVILQRLTQPDTSDWAQDEGDPDIYEMRTDPKPALIEQLLQIPLQETTENKNKAIARALSLSIISDVCYLVQKPKNSDQVELLAGYDLIREVFLPVKALKREDLLHIMDAWEDNQSFRLSDAHANTRDAATLTLLLRYHRMGNLLAYPLSLPDQLVAGGVIFLSPYTNKAWGQETLDLLDKIKTTLSLVLFTTDPYEKLKLDLERSRVRHTTLTQDKEILTRALAQMGSAVEVRENAIKQIRAQFQIEKLEILKRLEQCQDKIKILSDQLKHQKDFNEALERTKSEIERLSEARDQLRIALSRANARIKGLESQSGQTGPVRLSVESQVLSLDSIAANARLTTATRLSQNSIILEILNPDGQQMIRTDPALLQTVLGGLIDNAIQASEPGNKIQLSQALSLETGMLNIEVTDLGEGLTSDEQRILFNGEQTQIPGIGSIQAIREAIRAIRLLNGKIWIKSQKGAFTTFRVQLPVRIID